MRRYEVLRVNRVFQGFFAVDEALVTYEQNDGTMSTPASRLSVERGDAVGVIVYDRDARKLLFVRQFRYPAVKHSDPWVLECVAGSLALGEQPEAAARRELREETGYDTDSFVHLADCYSSPGGMSESVTIFFSEVGTSQRTAAGGGLAHEGEDIEVVAYTPQEVEAMLGNNEIRDAKTLVGLLAAKSRGLY